MSLQLAVFESPMGRLMADLSADAQDLEFGTGPHGYTDLSCSALQRLSDRFRLYDRPGIPHVEVNWHGTRVWEGRLEDLAIRSRTIGGGGVGYWSALFDVPYTALWSNDKISAWRQVVETESSTSKPQLYGNDKQNRLQANLKKNSIYASGDDAFAWVIELPDASATQAKRLTVSYDYNLPSNWTVQGIAWAGGFASGVTSNITTAGGAATGTFTWDLSATPRLIVGLRFFNSSGSPFTNTSEDDAFYVRFTSPRVTASGAAIYADEIAAALVSYVNGVNATQIQNITSFIESPSLDLRDEVYEDIWPGDILDRLIGLGDNQTPPAQWEAAIWEDRILRVHTRGKYSRTWYVDVAAPDMERSIAALRNSAYAVYQEAGGRSLRTAVSTDADRVAIHEVTRRAAVAARTTSVTQAATHRDAYLADNAEAKARAAIDVTDLYDAGGARYPGFLARSGDIIVVRNLPPTHSSEIDRRRAFRCSETRYFAGRKAVRLTPELQRPSLGVMAARRAAGVQ